MITGMISEICSLLPAQSVLLSATLPELNEELPVLANDFTERYVLYFPAMVVAFVVCASSYVSFVFVCGLV